MKEFIQKTVDLFASIPDFAMGLLLLLFAILVGALGALAVKAILKRTSLGRKIREIEGKNGRKESSTGHAISTVGKLVFLILFLIFLPAALAKLGMEGVTESVNMLTEKLLGYVPNVIAFALILVIGALIADVVFLLVAALLASLALDDKLNGWLTANTPKTGKPIPFSAILSYTLKTLILILFTVEGVNALGFAVLTSVGRAIIAYVPALLVALLFGVGAFVLCRMLDGLLKNASLFMRLAAKTALIGTSFFIVLSHLGIAPFIVNTAFIVLISACGIAFALAVGLGGRQFVQDNLSGMRLFKKKEQEQKENQNKQ